MKQRRKEICGSFSSFLVSAREQFKQGTPLFGKEGAFHRILEDFLDSALEGEMESHLSVTKPQTKNRRNGKMCKTLQTEYGQVEIETPRDRDGSFSPEIVQKRQTILAEGLILLAVATIPAIFIDWNLANSELNAWMNGTTIEGGRFIITVLISFILIALMIVVGIWIPARKAMKVQPAEVLHNE